MKEKSPYSVVPQKVKKSTRLTAVASNPMDVVSRVTGEVVAATPYIGRRSVRDISDFVKFYDVGVLCRLSLTEVKVLSYVLSVLDFSDRLHVNYEDCGEMTGLSRTVIYKGLRGLTEKDIIKRDKKGWYWINPNIAYRGSRDELMRQ